MTQINRAIFSNFGASTGVDMANPESLRPLGPQAPLNPKSSEGPPSQPLQASKQAKMSELASTPPGELSKNKAKALRKSAEDFESIFLDLMLKSMRNTVIKSDFMDGGHAEEMYRSMLDGEYAKILAAQRHTGIADNIEKQLIETMVKSGEIQPPTNSKLPKLQGAAAYKAAENGFISRSTSDTSHFRIGDKDAMIGKSDPLLSFAKPAKPVTLVK